jgi:hypothetical protein
MSAVRRPREGRRLNAARVVPGLVQLRRRLHVSSFPSSGRSIDAELTQRDCIILIESRGRFDSEKEGDLDCVTRPGQNTAKTLDDAKSGSAASRIKEKR